jgi:hypothetical protein
MSGGRFGTASPSRASHSQSVSRWDYSFSSHRGLIRCLAVMLGAASDDWRSCAVTPGPSTRSHLLSADGSNYQLFVGLQELIVHTISHHAGSTIGSWLGAAPARSCQCTLC